jgi:hypothetical protein
MLNLELGFGVKRLGKPLKQTNLTPPNIMPMIGALSKIEDLNVSIKI